MPILNMKEKQWEFDEYDEYEDGYTVRPSVQSRDLKATEPGRKEESYSLRFRTDRVFSVGHEWFFTTREGVDFGPYNSKHQAQKALDTFLFIVA